MKSIDLSHENSFIMQNPWLTGNRWLMPIIHEIKMVHCNLILRRNLEMTQDLLRSTVTRFLSVGFLNTVVGFTLIYGSKYFLEFGDVPANLLGYGVGILLSFTLNSTWTFSYQGPQLPALGRFLLAFAIAYTVNLLVVLACIQWAGINPYLAHAVGLIPYTTTFYLVSRLFVFPTATAPSVIVSEND